MDPSSRVLVLLVATMAMAAAGVSGDFAADQAECSDKLASLATCLTYVQEQATAAAPTLDCCAGLKSVLQTSRKCLCVLVKDRDNPNLGLKINVNKALGLPQVCKASANISDCPRLLNLPPNSKDAQVFEQYVKQTGGAPCAPGGAGSNAAASAGTQKSGGVASRWLVVGGGARAVVLSAIFSAAAPLAMPFLLLRG